MVVYSLYRLNDQYFVQGLGVEAQSAVAVGGMLGIWFMAFGQMVATGTLAIASRRFGEGHDERAHDVIRTGLHTGFAVGLALAVATVIGLPWLCELLIRGDDVAVERALARDYMLWICGGQVVLAVLPTIDAAFFAMRNTRTPMLLQVVSIATNAALNSQLVPIHGVAGAGAATIASRSLALIIGAVLLHRAGVAVLVGPTSRAVSTRILVIGLPSCVSISVYSMVYSVILAVTFPHFGASGRSALGVAFGIESVFYCFFWGIGTAVASLVGRSLGEGRPERAVAITHTAARLSLFIGAATAVLFWLFGPAMVSTMADAPEAIAANVEYLDHLAWAQPFQAMQVIYEQTLIGAGATRPAMIASVACNALRIPLAQLLAVVIGFGLPGIWWAVNISSMAKFVWVRALFRAGRWQTHEV